MKSTLTLANVLAALAGNGSFFVINVEVKPELGEGNSCPYIQGIAYYGKKVAQYLGRREEERTRLPCFILYLAGPFLGVAGVICNHRKILADPLIGPIPLMLLRYDREQMMKIARVFTALESAYKMLHEYYNSPETGPQSMWPYYQAFNYKHKQVKFEYIKQLYEDKLLFVVETKQNSDSDIPERLLVKFTESYGEVVHKFCADSGFAPKLFGCYKLSERWKVVIMEYLEDYENLFDVVGARVEWKEKIKKFIEEMHHAGFVHGDLRKPNILYKATDESVNVVLVDFDWAGEAGKVFYPSFLNIGSVKRHSDAISDKVITPEHDIFSLNTLM